ncbi:hypothetical protein [Planctomycetes bacterium TBK1r]|uniref:Uncharacterized protein n=1 Tax=Stieleria magnilauensis TaxID=2527963 RepID=A0ABX5XHL3_9BACT|nr:hypothetical protein TBK1r_01570 [Planctomycetes bacterium TBK1r]
MKNLYRALTFAMMIAAVPMDTQVNAMTTTDTQGLCTKDANVTAVLAGNSSTKETVSAMNKTRLTTVT